MSREAFAKKAAKLAAVEIYKAAKDAPTVKVASAGGIKETFDIEVLAKKAAVEAYKAIMKAAQPVAPVAPDAMNVQGMAMRFGMRNLAGYLGRQVQGEDVSGEAQYAQKEVPGFLSAYQAQKTADGTDPSVLAQHLEVVKKVLRDAGLQA